MGVGVVTGRRGIVVGGAGAVGGMFANVLCEAGWRVATTDVAGTPSAQHIVCDARHPGADLMRELQAADAVIVATPEPVALEAVPRLARHLAAGALVVDTASVKTHVVSALSGFTQPHLEYVSVNPMFGPSLAPAGRPVAVVPVHQGPVWHDVASSLMQQGMRLVELGAETHDRLTAVLQSLTHASLLAFGLALVESDVDVELAAQLAPPPFTTALAMLSRLCSASPETYWEIQQANPHAGAARAALASAHERLSQCIAHGDGTAFAGLIDEIHTALRPVAGEHAHVCQDLYTRAVIAPTPRATQRVREHASATTA